MSFSLTRPSTASSVTFPNNNQGSCKVKLVKEAFLPEDDREVALANISFPISESPINSQRYLSLVDLEYPIGIHISIEGVKESDDDAVDEKTYYLAGGEIQQELDDLGKPKDGNTYWDRLITQLNHKIQFNLAQGTQKWIENGTPKYPVFTWVNVFASLCCI